MKTEKEELKNCPNCQYKIEKIIPEVFDDVGYKLYLTDLYKDYIKRLIIR